LPGLPIAEAVPLDDAGLMEGLLSAAPPC
jgi:hypothetical protein